jgi:hypothetical protein
MGLFATILLNQAVMLPDGRVTTHNPDHKKKLARTGNQIELAARNEAIRMANIERIYAAIAASTRPVAFSDIEAVTSLSYTTVFYAVAALETWPGGSRIVRSHGTKHTFKVKK